MTFKKHKNFQKDKIGKTIYKDLDKLRKWRNRADYDDVMDDVNKFLLKSKNLTEEILYLLSKIEKE